MRWILCGLIFILASCGPRSMEEYRRSGRESTKKLIVELCKVQSHKDFSSHEASLKDQFTHLSEIMIAAREHWLQNGDEDIPDFSAEDKMLSERLKTELLRISALEDGEPFIASCQHEAIAALQKAKKRLAVY